MFKRPPVSYLIVYGIGKQRLLAASAPGSSIIP
jgi:hypothetical protein